MDRRSGNTISATAPVRDDAPAPRILLGALPRQMTSFVGRDRETREIKQLLEAAPLVTLTGPGGVGKTRLALQVAAEMTEVFEHGVCFVPLTPLRAATMMTSVVARALGLREAEGTPLLAALKNYLQEKQVLLLLDNFEHVLDGAPLVSDLLNAAPHLKILVTSREALRLYGEQEYIVSPFALPELRHLPSVERLTQYDAVRLFIDRAHAVNRDLQVTSENAVAVAEICRRLDGLPLAIELAAARIRLLAPEQLLARLEHPLPLLTSGARDLPARQQTLRNTITWSYDLLTAEEQQLFRRLAVFVGGWTLEAAEAVCGDAGDMALDVLDGLDSLTAKSLVRHLEPLDSSSAETRCTLLETVREFALEQLTEAGERYIMEQRHASYFLALAEQAEPALCGPEQAAWFDRLERDHDNLHQAHCCLVRQGDASLGLRFAGALYRFWRVRGYLSEGRQKLAEALDQAAPFATDAPVLRARAKALLGAGWLARDQGDYAVAQAYLDKGLTLARATADSRTAIWLLINLGFVARYRGNPAHAYAFYEEALTLAQAIDDRETIAAAAGNLGLAARDRGDFEIARQRFEQSLDVARTLGDTLGIAWPLTNLGQIARTQREYATARRLYTEALTIWQQLGDRQNLAHARFGLGMVALGEARYGEAGNLLGQSLVQLIEVGDKRGAAFVLEGIAMLAAAVSRPEQAIRLAGAAGGIRHTLHAEAPPSWQAERDPALHPAREALTPGTYTQITAEEVARPLEQVVSYALALAAEVQAASPALAPVEENKSIPGYLIPVSSLLLQQAPIEPSQAARLSKREREVLHLIAMGKTNREIAVDLVVSEYTVMRHVQNIFNKLAVSSRTAAATVALRNGLV